MRPPCRGHRWDGGGTSAPKCSLPLLPHRSALPPLPPLPAPALKAAPTTMAKLSTSLDSRWARARQGCWSQARSMWRRLQMASRESQVRAAAAALHVGGAPGGAAGGGPGLLPAAPLDSRKCGGPAAAAAASSNPHPCLVPPLLPPTHPTPHTRSGYTPYEFIDFSDVPHKHELVATVGKPIRSVCGVRRGTAVGAWARTSHATCCRFSSRCPAAH